MSERARAVRAAALPAAAFALFSALAAVFLFRSEVLYDTDSYFHLFVARAYRKLGNLHEFPWTRFSVYRDGFGDKEWLFHVLLMPFAPDRPTTAGGRLALALLNGGIAAAITALSQRVLRGWALLAPALVFFGSLDFLGRAIRLRPELLALLLFLAAAWCVTERRYRLLGIVALVFTLAYTGFHALVGLCGIWFLVIGLREKRWEWPLVLYPTLGMLAGLLLHPQFPHNLVIWKVQNWDFFLVKDQLDTSSENRGLELVGFVRDNLGFVLGAAALVLLRDRIAGAATRSERRPRSAGDHPDPLLVWGTAAAVFAALYVVMMRFSTYAYPFATIALAYALARLPPPASSVRGRTLAGRAGALAALAAVLFLAVPGRQMWGMATATGGQLSREQDWANAAAVLPAEAKVASDWGLTPNLLFFGPQAFHLNVLNSVFMAVPYPEAYAAWRAILDGRERDISGTLRRDLDSEYLALSLLGTDPRVLDRIEADPHMELVYAGYTLVYRVLPESSTADPEVGDPGR